MKLTKRQNEIIDAAMRLTAAGGIQNLTVKNLSREIGVTEPAIYRHFRNKAEIIRAMIGRFDKAVPTETEDCTGLKAVTNFIHRRIEQVMETPELAKIMFSEELFMDDPEFSGQLSAMMHHHKEALCRHLAAAQKRGEVRSGIAPDTLFRILIGPFRLLVKQWGMTNGAFSLREKGNELIETLVQLLKP